MFESLAEPDEEDEEERRGSRAPDSFSSVGIMISISAHVAYVRICCFLLFLRLSVTVMSLHCQLTSYQAALSQVSSGLRKSFVHLRSDSEFTSISIAKNSCSNRLKYEVFVSRKNNISRSPNQFLSWGRETPKPRHGRRAANLPVIIRHIEPMKQTAAIFRCEIMSIRKSIHRDWLLWKFGLVVWDEEIKYTNYVILGVLIFGYKDRLLVIERPRSLCNINMGRKTSKQLNRYQIACTRKPDELSR